MSRICLQVIWYFPLGSFLTRRHWLNLKNLVRNVCVVSSEHMFVCINSLQLHTENVHILSSGNNNKHNTASPLQ